MQTGDGRLQLESEGGKAQVTIVKRIKPGRGNRQGRICLIPQPEANDIGCLPDEGTAMDRESDVH